MGGANLGIDYNKVVWRVDEMLAILTDRNAIVDKKQSEYAQSKISHMYRFGLGVEEE